MMRVAFYSTRFYDIEYFQPVQSSHHFTFIKEIFDATTVQLAKDHDAVCISASDLADKALIEELRLLKIGLIMVRSSTLDNVDTHAAHHANITIKFLPGYSPQAIAEFTAALLLGLNRKTHLAFEKTHTGNFSVKGLMGYNLHKKAVGIIGMGRIGQAFAGIMKGFDCRILANDLKKSAIPVPGNMQYVTLSYLLEHADIISLHCSLDEANTYMINKEALEKIKPGAILINTARGKLVDSKAILEALKKGSLGGYAADVYENESKIFYHTFNSVDEIDDPVLKELIQQPNVLLTAHQAYLTKEAMYQIARTTIHELTYYESLHDESASRLMI